MVLANLNHTWSYIWCSPCQIFCIHRMSMDPPPNTHTHTPCFTHTLFGAQTILNEEQLAAKQEWSVWDQVARSGTWMGVVGLQLVGRCVWGSDNSGWRAVSKKEVHCVWGHVWAPWCKYEWSVQNIPHIYSMYISRKMERSKQPICIVCRVHYFTMRSRGITAMRWGAIRGDAIWGDAIRGDAIWGDAIWGDCYTMRE